ncbi:Holliday junction resolvase RuvX [Magnetospira sp. QH-2]|uniref:Holliday junction resolvase RuvX n=1 Tax=Magnetospira sp. (strain QH-2) TaxID=1288970 RepID=UPI0005F9BE90|nr:Holliday junction resolvase RuvX [Magnetospira sp. QH-2]
MILEQIRDIKQHLPTGRRLMGVDPGTKTLGLALSDLTLTIATPLITLKRTKLSKDVVELERLFREHEVGGLVLGLPVSMDGTEGPRCQSVRHLADSLNERFDLPIGFWDERLSTAAVERILVNEADLTRKKRAKVVDRAAAAYILQGVLDALAY